MTNEKQYTGFKPGELVQFPINTGMPRFKVDENYRDFGFDKTPLNDLMQRAIDAALREESQRVPVSHAAFNEGINGGFVLGKYYIVLVSEVDYEIVKHHRVTNDDLMDVKFYSWRDIPNNSPFERRIKANVTKTACVDVISIKSLNERDYRRELTRNRLWDHSEQAYGVFHLNLVGSRGLEVVALKQREVSKVIIDSMSLVED